MNMYTKLIMDWLKVSAEVAMKVQTEMGCAGVDFSESSDRQLKRAAREAFEELGERESRAALDRRMGA